MMQGIFVGVNAGTLTVQVSSDGLTWTDAESYTILKEISKRYTRQLKDSYIRFYSTVPLGATIYFKGD